MIKENIKISVILPLKGNDKYLTEAINSVLIQTYNNFELIIVKEYGDLEENDKILENIKDARVLIIKNEKRLGLVKSLNRGISVSEGSLIARMDSDDICLPDRFKTQVNFLKYNNNINILSTGYNYIDKNNKINKIVCKKRNSNLIGWELLFHNCIGHPTIMMRKEILLDIGLYDDSAKYCEDYELWTRAISKDIKIETIPISLMHIRLHEKNTSLIHEIEKKNNFKSVVINYVKNILNINVDPDTYIKMLEPSKIISIKDATNVFALLNDLYDQYCNNRKLTKTDFNEINKQYYYIVGEIYSNIYFNCRNKELLEFVLSSLNKYPSFKIFDIHWIIRGCIPPHYKNSMNKI